MGWIGIFYSPAGRKCANRASMAVTGGLPQALATVLYEDMRFDKTGRVPATGLADSEAIPPIVESPQPDGPFGARLDWLALKFGVRAGHAWPLQEML